MLNQPGISYSSMWMLKYDFLSYNEIIHFNNFIRENDSTITHSDGRSEWCHEHVILFKGTVWHHFITKNSSRLKVKVRELPLNEICGRKMRILLLPNESENSSSRKNINYRFSHSFSFVQSNTLSSCSWWRRCLSCEVERRHEENEKKVTLRVSAEENYQRFSSQDNGRNGHMKYLDLSLNSEKLSSSTADQIINNEMCDVKISRHHLLHASGAHVKLLSPSLIICC